MVVPSGRRKTLQDLMTEVLKYLKFFLSFNNKEISENMKKFRFFKISKMLDLCLYDREWPQVEAPEAKALSNESFCITSNGRMIKAK
jgi:hypothetical protein